MNTVSRMVAARPRERPVILVIRETGSRLRIRIRFVRVTYVIFWFHNDLGGALRTDVDLATGARKTIAAGTVEEIPFYGGAAIMA